MTTTSYPDHYLNPYLDTLFGTTCCLCFLLGTLGNMAAFFFFKFSTDNVPHVLYKIITLADAYICVCALPIGVCYLTSRGEGLIFGNEVLCHVWGYSWNVCGRLSIFLVVVLSTTRTITILKPFYEIRLMAVMAAIPGYIALLAAQLLVMDLLEGAQVKFKRDYAECVVETNPEKSNPVLYFLGYFIPFIVPMFVVIVSCAITIHAVAVVPRRRDSHTKAQQSASCRATWTILIFTLCYSVFNIPLVFDRMIMALDFFTGYSLSIYRFPYSDYYLNFTYSVSIAANSAINPWLYLWRMKNFRNFLRYGVLDAIGAVTKCVTRCDTKCAAPCRMKKKVSHEAGLPLKARRDVSRLELKRRNTCELTYV